MRVTAIPDRRYCDPSRLLVGFVFSFVASAVNFRKVEVGATFMKFNVDFQHLRQMSILTSERSRSVFKVKGQGQS